MGRTQCAWTSVHAEIKPHKAQTTPTMAWIIRSIGPTVRSIIKRISKRINHRTTSSARNALSETKRNFSSRREEREQRNEPGSIQRHFGVVRFQGDWSDVHDHTQGIQFIPGFLQIELYCLNDGIRFRFEKFRLWRESMQLSFVVFAVLDGTLPVRTWTPKRWSVIEGKTTRILFLSVVNRTDPPENRCHFPAEKMRRRWFPVMTVSRREPDRREGWGRSSRRRNALGIWHVGEIICFWKSEYIWEDLFDLLL